MTDYKTTEDIIMAANNNIGADMALITKSGQRDQGQIKPGCAAVMIYKSTKGATMCVDWSAIESLTIYS